MAKNLDLLDVKNANQNAIEKSRNIEEDIQHIEKMEGHTNLFYLTKIVLFKSLIIFIFFAFIKIKYFFDY